GLSRLLQQRSGDGYVFRVDLRLRPDPSSTPVAISTASALHYYEREGRTWERAAMIKARACAGDARAGEALIAEIAPFVWRKHLDFAALADVHDMKRQMQTFRGQSEIAVEGHNVKIGRGGIREAFAGHLLGHLNAVRAHYGKLFEGDPTGTAKLPAADYSAGPDDPRLLEHFATLGFKQPVMVAQTVRQWMVGDYRVFRMEQTRTAFVEFVPALIVGLAHAEEPDHAVTAFDRFLQALQRGGRLISLLSQNRDLVALVALILGAAPRLGDMLARRPQIMDGLIDPRFFGAMPDQRELSARLAATLADANSYEEFLDRLRLFGQESLFLIGTRILSGTVSAQQASVAFADVAEGIVHTVHGLVTEQFAAQYGRIKGQQTAILAMGRLGSREMTASSDLDLIL